MELGRYKVAATILEKMCEYNPEDHNIEFSYYSIGQCYFRMGKLETALHWLSKSYDLYRNNIQERKSFTHFKTYRETIQLYCKALRINLQDNLADKIMSD